MELDYRRSLCLPLLLVGKLCIHQPASAGDALEWNTKNERVNAEIHSWKVPQLLQHVAAATGWQIYIDPDINDAVSAKFRDRPAGEALERLLGKLNFALLPQTNAPPKFYVFRTSLQDATRPVLPVLKTNTVAADGKAIPNELVVTLKSGENIEDLARKLGARIIGRADSLNTYRLQFENAASADSARETLRNDSAVASIDYNYIVPRPDRPEALTYGSSGPRSLYPKAITDGKNVVVGLIDSAIQPQESNLSEFVLPTLSVGGEIKPSNAGPTHGTSMAETILRGLSFMMDDGSGTAVRILPVDVYGNRANTTTYDVAVGIYKAINAGATVINLSLGSEGQSSFLHNVIKTGHEQGVMFLAAAGNEPVATPTYPAAYPEVIAVTAADKRGNIASYANHGDFVDAAAPGSSIVNFRNRQYLVMGTSASTAYAAGMAAALAETTKKSVADLEASVRKALAVKPQ